MNWRSWVPLAMAAVLGLVAAKVGRDYINRARGTGEVTGATISVVIANSDVAPGSALTTGDLSVARLPAETVPRTAFEKPSDLVGRVALLPLVKGQTILESFLAPAGSAAGPQALVPPGMRAVSVEITEASGVAGLLVPGCYVDIVSTLSDEKQRRPMAKMIVENAKVLAVGQRLQASSKKEEEDEPARPKSVTLLVGPRDVEAIELAGSAGRLRLVLRGSLDNSRSPSVGITVADLMGTEQDSQDVFVQLPQDVPAAVTHTEPVKTSEVRLVEIIRNGKAERVQMPGVPMQQPSALTGDGTQMNPVFPEHTR